VGLILVPEFLHMEKYRVDISKCLYKPYIRLQGYIRYQDIPIYPEAQHKTWISKIQLRHCNCNQNMQQIIKQKEVMKNDRESN